MITVVNGSIYNGPSEGETFQQTSNALMETCLSKSWSWKSKITLHFSLKNTKTNSRGNCCTPKIEEKNDSLI